MALRLVITVPNFEFNHNRQQRMSDTLCRGRVATDMTNVMGSYSTNCEFERRRHANGSRYWGKIMPYTTGNMWLPLNTVASRFLTSRLLTC
jgi:hypothetical protein